MTFYPSNPLPPHTPHSHTHSHTPSHTPSHIPSQHIHTHTPLSLSSLCHTSPYTPSTSSLTVLIPSTLPTLGEVKTLMIQLLRAVHHLHDNWILHRDLKASNLLLSHKGILKVHVHTQALRAYTCYVNAACAECITIFSTGSKFRPVLNFT